MRLVLCVDNDNEYETTSAVSLITHQQSHAIHACNTPFFVSGRLNLQYPPLCLVLAGQSGSISAIRYGDLFPSRISGSDCAADAKK